MTAQTTDLATDLSTLSSAELRSLIEAAGAELGIREGQPAELAPMRVTRRFGRYDDRRYGRPWIARVTSWPVGGRPEMEWGSYIGDMWGRSGDRGEARGHRAVGTEGQQGARQDEERVGGR